MPLLDYETKPPLAPLLPTGSTTATIVAEVTKSSNVKRPPMRSSIACMRCRRSKIKCDNDGKASSPCETCIKSGRDCQYPAVNTPTPRRTADPQIPTSVVSPATGSITYKRDDGLADRGPERKRLKKLEDAFRTDAPSSGAYYAEEVLSTPYLTEAMWMQVCNIYRLHFASELPFLHMPTLKENMGTGSKTKQKRRSADTNLVLLGVLTLTSRFHSDLVKYVAQTIANQSSTKGRSPATAKADPWAASEYYADVLTKALGPLSASMTLASIERVQAFLMLGLYEWSQAKRKTGGLGAWMYVGVAIRMAQALGLSFDGRPGGKRHRRAAVSATFAAHADPQAVERRALKADGIDSSPRRDLTKVPVPLADDIVTNEIRRRTMFSCLILDRLLSCGEKRLPAIRSKDLQIQLPCSDFAFDLGQEVRTRYLKSLNETDTADNEQETNESGDSVLARFIQLVDIWGEISKYSFAGGRRVEKRPPWEETEFLRLRRVLDKFYKGLPSIFTLSRSNYYVYESHQASSAYVSLHMLGAVCRIMLHREYIPFIPIRCDGPEGPLDEPTFPKGSAPPGFWDESAEQIFKAARDIVDLIEICQGCDKLPMSALVVFSIWTAAFVGIYAWHFPALDAHKHMLDGMDGGQTAKPHGRINNKVDYHIQTHGPTGITYSALNKMSTWLQMACTYVSYFQDMDKFYEGVKEDYRKHMAKRNSGDGPGELSIRMGGGGGGLDEWKVHGPKVTNNGMILSDDDAIVEASDRSRTSSTPAGLDCGSSTGPEGVRYMPVYGDGSSSIDRHSLPVIGEEHVNVSAMETPGVGCGGVAFMSQDGGSFPSSSGTISAHGLPMSGEAGLGLASATIQPWERYPHDTEQQLNLQMQAEQHMPVTTQGYEMGEPVGYSDMRDFYPDVLPYIDRFQGMRWQDASQAAGIEHFSHGDSIGGGHAVWIDQPFII
ncbi:c6 zinc finger domain containing protein [Grosmannia clavigera kw1407]|uniref:C6 zinc finger domain containing protein n=1 Tax=Grosmannia clavigera (strain kw1407 / UAMH 11150) TaxID=655863 RepID=F0X967_GROCL|nr:c6 zinc finger domain containing protein [Grosmannia clavigera kw1407]EFX05831.1 c6 zinc finger domain containing protein [Grosmannia clavigera kw1407]